MQKTFKATSIGIAFLGIFYLVAMSGTPSQAQVAIPNPLQKIIDTIVGSIKDAINGAVSQVQDLISDLKDKILNAASAGIDLGKNVVGKVVDQINGILTGVVNIVGGAINALKDWLGNIGVDNIIGDLLEPLLELLTDQVSQYLDLVGTLVESGSDEVGVVLSASTDLLKPVRTFVNDLVQSLGRLVTGVNTKAATSVIQVLTSTVQALQGVVNKIVGILANPKLGDDAKSALNGILSLVRGTLTDVLSGVNALSQSSSGSVRDAVTALIKAIQAVINLIPASVPQ